jgi:hypothetical protein
MNPKVQTPNVDQIIGTGKDALVAARPSARPFVDSGFYGDIFAGWRAQLALVARRLVDECKSARLPNAEKKALQELAASEFGVPLSLDPQTAVGLTTLNRGPNVTQQSIIKKGTRFRMDADPTATPAVQAAQYESVEPVVVPMGLSAGIRVRIRATRPGPHANLPMYFSTVARTLQIADTLADTGITAGPANAAGGSSGASDADIRQLAKALYSGQYAPTNAAIMAGALSSVGVKHGALFQDNLLAQTVIFVADESWSGGNTDDSGDIFRNAVKQALKDNWAGFGGRVVVRGVSNRVVSAIAVIQLTSPQYSSDVLAIADNVRAALRVYLDERPDWYTFDTNMMAGIVSVADPRILACIAPAAVTITSATNANPSVITAANHGLDAGQIVVVSNIYTNVAGVPTLHSANGTWQATVIDQNTFSVPVAGSATYTGPATVPAATNILGVSYSNPMVITTLFNHPFSVGQIVQVSGVLGTTSANGVWVVAATTTLTITIAAGANAPYISGGTIQLVLPTSQVPAVALQDLVTGAPALPIPTNAQSPFAVHHMLADTGVKLKVVVPS